MLERGEGDTPFSREVDGDGLEGRDLHVRNPLECVQAGLLEKSGLAPFGASVSDDGMHVDLQWEGQFFDIVYEEANSPDAWTPTFNISRASFGTSQPRLTEEPWSIFPSTNIHLSQLRAPPELVNECN